MACQLVSETVRGKLVTLTQMNCTTGVEELSKILQVTGKVAYEYLEGTANLHHHLALLQGSNEEDIQFIKEVVCRCHIEGKQYTVDTLGFSLQNNYLLFMGVFAFYIRANYQEFFTEGLQEIEDKKEAARLKKEAELQMKQESES